MMQTVDEERKDNGSVLLVLHRQTFKMAHSKCLAV